MAGGRTPSGAYPLGFPIDDPAGGKAYVSAFVQVDSTGAESGAGTSASPTVVSEGSSAKTDRSITASTTSQQAAPANTARKKLFIQNLDAAINVHINLGAAATTGSGSVRLVLGASLELTGSSQTVNVIAVSGTPVVTIWEF